MKRYERRQRLTAWLLLMLYVPLLLAISTHVHSGQIADETTCEECVNHVCHELHFSQKSFTIDDCVLCQLHDAPCLLPTLTGTPLLFAVINPAVPARESMLPTAASCIYSPRAPPYSF
ncbi:MAG: hypothetical protein IJ196_06885 [Prevotella sp.]|nr:hypothetical protein [Prevotella sp.]